MEKEIWKPLTYHGENFGDTYEISNTGRLRNKITGIERKQSFNKKGYLHCVISRGRSRKIAIKIHRAVAENFIDGDKSLTINHKDCDKTNNHYENLEFVTQAENNFHARKNGLINYQYGCDNHNSKFTPDDIRKIRKIFEGKKYKVKEIADMFNADISVVSRIVNKKTYKNIK